LRRIKKKMEEKEKSVAKKNNFNTNYMQKKWIDYKKQKEFKERKRFTPIQLNNNKKTGVVIIYSVSDLEDLNKYLTVAEYICMFEELKLLYPKYKFDLLQGFYSHYIITIKLTKQNKNIVKDIEDYINQYFM